MATILIVEANRLVKDVVVRRLEEAGHQVIACPGPSAPDYTCLGSRGERCPLASAADLIMVDTQLQGEEFIDAASGVDLVGYYTGTGKPVVALRPAPELTRLFEEEHFSTLAWPPSRDELLEAVRTGLGSGEGISAIS